MPGLQSFRVLAVVFLAAAALALPAEAAPKAPASPAAPAATQAEPATHPHAALGDQPGTDTWPLQLDLPQSVKDAYPAFAPKLEKRRAKEGKLAIMCWTPPKTRRIRAILLIMENTDSLEFGTIQPVREVAARRKMGIVYLRFGQFVHEYLKHEPRDVTSMQAIMDEIARRTGILEYRHAPWVAFGKSSVGRFPAYMAWAHPDRVIAGIVWHGEVPPWGGEFPPAWAKFDQTVLHLNVNGENEWGGTWFRHVRPGLLNFHARGWLPHQFVSWGVGHGDYPEETSGKNNPRPRQSRPKVWAYMAAFLDKALTVRLPADGYPTDKPFALRQAKEEDGYCIDPRAIEAILNLPPRPLVEKDGVYVLDPKDAPPAASQPAVDPATLIRKAADVPPAERKNMMWVPDKDLADTWLKTMQPATGQ